MQVDCRCPATVCLFLKMLLMRMCRKGRGGRRISAHFSDAERAALASAESLTEIARTHAPDECFEPLKAHFDAARISDLTFAFPRGA